MQKQQFGMMDEGYFVPKSDILSWINDLLKIHISKIQALGSGSIYCQLFDIIHPGKLNLQKVNWKAKNDNQFLANFRLLQSAFQKAGIKRHIEVQKLVKAKYQDNLEFIQWFKRYFDLNCGSKGQGYDAVQKRNKIVPDFGFAQKTIVPKVYSGSGQVQSKAKEVKEKESKPPGSIHQKKQQPSKQQKSNQEKAQKTEKIQKKIPVKIPVKPSTTSHPTRAKIETHEKKEQPKKVPIKKQQPTKQAQIPISVKKQDAVKKKPVSVHQPQPIKKNVQSAGLKNNLSTVHHGVQQSATKNKQLPKNDQKVKQLEQRIDKIKLIVSSGREYQVMVNEIRDLLGIGMKNQTLKVEQVKQQLGKQVKKQTENKGVLLGQKVQDIRSQDMKGQTLESKDVEQTKHNNDVVVQTKENKTVQNPSSVQATHDQDLLEELTSQNHQKQPSQQNKQELLQVKIPQNTTQELPIQSDQHSQPTQIKNIENQVSKQQLNEVINQKQIQVTQVQHHQEGNDEQKHQNIDQKSDQNVTKDQNIQKQEQEKQEEENDGEQKVIEGQKVVEEQTSNDVF